jgi:hypothetical protein
MRINTRSKVTVAAGFLGIAALFGSAAAVAAVAPGGMPNPVHVAGSTPHGAQPAGMPDPAHPLAGMPDPVHVFSGPVPHGAQPDEIPQG